MDDIVEASQGQRRLLMMLLGVFACMAALLAVIGIYGLIAFSVVQRTKEIGIRRALGAQQDDILGLVIAQGLKLTLIGVAFGMGAAFALTRVLRSLLFHVSATAPATFLGVSLLFILAAIVASYVPARRAVAIDPMSALRIG